MKGEIKKKKTLTKNQKNDVHIKKKYIIKMDWRIRLKINKSCTKGLRKIRNQAYQKKKLEIKRMRIKEGKTTYDKLGLKDKIQKNISKLYKKVTIKN